MGLNLYEVNIKDLGAAGEGTSLDTMIIQRAIDLCADAGGGTVYFPAGIYRSGTIYLKSNVRLYLHSGAMLLQSADMHNYEEMNEICYVHHTGSRYVFIYGNRLQNIGIEGTGTINGNNALDKHTSGKVRRGPMPVLIENSENILIKGITVLDSPGWSITFFGSKSTCVENVKVINSYADGINHTCCRDIVIRGVLVENSGDDAICLKNDSVDNSCETGPDCGFTTNNVVIENAVIRNTRHPAIKIGTGTFGVFRDIRVSNCVVDTAKTMFSIQLMRPTYLQFHERAIENIKFSDITVNNVKRMIDITAMDVEKPVVRDIQFNRITVNGVHEPSVIAGLPQAPVKDIVLSNIKVHVQGEKASEASDPGIHWLVSRYVYGLKLMNVWLSLKGFIKSLLMFENGKQLEIENLAVENTADKHPLIEFIQSKGLFIHNCKLHAAGALVLACGEKTEDVRFSGNDLSEEMIPVDTAEDIKCASFFPQIHAVQYEALTVKKHIRANECFVAEVSVMNEGPEGMHKVEVMVNGEVSGTKWLWLRQGERKAVKVFTEKQYITGEYRIQAGGFIETAAVLPAPAFYEYGEHMGISRPEEPQGSCCVVAEIKNIGGCTGDEYITLHADNDPVVTQRVQIEPGEKKQVFFEYKPVNSRMNKLKLGDFPEWPFFTYANTDANFYLARGRIVIEAGGGQGRETDSEKQKLRVNEYGAVYQKVHGNFSIKVKVASQEVTGMYAGAGLIVGNEIISPGKGYGNLYLNTSPKYGGMGMWRADPDGDGILEGKEFTLGGCPVWYRIDKQGNTFTGYASRDGKEWKDCGKFTVAGAKQVQDVGIFANAFSSKNELCRVEFECLEIS